MKHIKVFAPGTVANLGCGFDVMGLTLDGVGDVLEVGVAENAEGFEIRNRSGVELPGNVEENVITPAVRALLEAYGLRRSMVSTNCWAVRFRASSWWSSP